MADVDGINGEALTAEEEMEIEKLEQELLADFPEQVERTKNGEGVDDKVDPTEAALKDALQNWTPGKLMKTRTNLGQQFYRTVGKTAEFKNWSLAKREKAQQEWLEQKLEEYVRTKSKEETRSKAAITKGKFRSMAYLIKKEGKVTALRYARRCMQQEGWTEWDDMWGHMGYFEAEKTYLDSFARSWSSRCSGNVMNQPSGSAGPSRPPTARALPPCRQCR